MATAPAVITRPEGRPERTLGWQVLEWTYDNLLQPDGPESGGPFQFTDEQIEFVLWWYALTPEGKWLYPRGVLERMKGWGKDPVGAALAIVDFVGPSRFSHWDENGDPVGERHSASLVILAAVSEEQTRNTMDLIGPMLSEKLIQECGIQVGRDMVRATLTNGTMKIASSSARSFEGKRTTMVVRNETHHWVSGNGGHAFGEVIDRNLAKARGGGARMLDITNSYQTGEDSIAERVHDNWRKQVTGRSRGSGLLFDSREAPPDVVMSDPESLKAGIIAARGDSTWLDVDGLIQAIYSSTSSAETSRRFYLNQKVAAEDAWVTAQWWDQCLDPDAKLQDGDEITLGFDGARTDDASALVACRVADGLLVPLGVWEKPTGPAGEEWEVDRSAVDGAVEMAFEKYKVSGFYSDVNEWESYVELWAERYRRKLKLKASPRNAVAWDMRGRGQVLVTATEAFQAAIETGTVRHNGDGTLRQHILNAKRRPSRYGITFGKEHRESSRKVDAVSAALLARMARQELVNQGKQRRSNGERKVVSY